MSGRLSFRILVSALALATLASAASGQVVINEIMYHPPRDRDGLQYVELFNGGAQETDISGWAFHHGIQFEFPKLTRLPPGGFVVVCRNRSEFVDRYGSGVRLAGEFAGRLSHGGERLELAEHSGKIVDSVKYSDRAPWPLAADGASASLERISPYAPGTDAANWASSRLPKAVAPAGTPGKTNDSYSPNLPPAVTEVELSPAAPQARQAATVRASVSDADGVNDVTLWYRVVGVGAETALPMQRLNGDARKGRYEAVIPGQPDGSIVRYRIRVTDGAGTVRAQPSTNDLRRAWAFGVFSNTNSARVPFVFVRHGSGEEAELKGARGRRALLSALNIEAPRGEDTLVLMPPGGGAVRVFDPVRVTRRKGGFKVRFLKDDTLRGMATLNVIFETPRSTLAEPLAFELYRMAGVPAPLAEHWRLWEDGKLRGYQLVFEQVNKSFLARNRRDGSGNLYKLLWYGNGLTGQHEKKTNVQDGHDDLIALVEGLNAAAGPAQWQFIDQHFSVTNFIDYYAVNMCIQNWDGFFNNYYTYHDAGGTGRWEIYPWDEDKTWGEYDGASEKHDWHTMPLTFGMNGDQPPGRRARPGAPSPRGMGGGMWWRPPGWFSGPLLAHPEFRKRFMARLREVCETIFTTEKMNPLIAGLEARLEPEIAGDALAEFRRDVQSFRNQVAARRKFILEELGRPSP
jgi:spore coat protein H